MQRDMDFEAMVPVDTPVEGVVTEVSTEPAKTKRE
jgi:hypothetical protein